MVRLPRQASRGHLQLEGGTRQRGIPPKKGKAAINRTHSKAAPLRRRVMVGAPARFAALGAKQANHENHEKIVQAWQQVDGEPQATDLNSSFVSFVYFVVNRPCPKTRCRRKLGDGGGRCQVSGVRYQVSVTATRTGGEADGEMWKTRKLPPKNQGAVDSDPLSVTRSRGG